MKRCELLKIDALSFEALQPLVDKSRAEGFEFIERLVNEYNSGTNRFQKTGEVLYGAYRNKKLVGICGLNQDPYLPEEKDVARVRHLYVLPSFRKQGVGKALIQEIIAEANKHFKLLTLRTFNPEADIFYQAIGFQTQPKIEHATHHIKLEQYFMTNTQPLTAMITGGNSGIGFATVRKLAARGYRVILASRNQDATTRAIERILAEQPDAQVESIPLDLASFESIRTCVDTFQQKGYPLHLLINNAGGSIKSEKARFTTDGFEMTFGINHLGHFMLTNLLLDDLRRSAPARVITVSSQLHDPKSPGPDPDFDYGNLKGEKYYHIQVFYRNSKLANMWFAYELNRRLDGTGVTSNAVCPGFVPEAIGARRDSPISKFFFSKILPKMPFARSLDQASDSYLAAATKPKYASEGSYFIVDGKEKPSSEESYDQEKAHILWEKSLIWCELDNSKGKN